MRDGLELNNRAELLESTLAAAAQDQRTVDDQRRSTAPLLEGMSFHDSIRHDDDRGSVTEIFDPRWGWHGDPLVLTSADMGVQAPTPHAATTFAGPVIKSRLPIPRIAFRCPRDVTPLSRRR